MKRKDIIEFIVGEMEFGGISRSKYENKRIKMKGGLTGQKVRAVVKKSRSDSAEVKLLELVEKSPYESVQTCSVFGECGGCSMLSFPYEKQLEIKESQVLKLFKGNGIEGFTYDGIVASPQNMAYRNKMEYTFGDEVKDGPMTLGMHKKGKYIDIITVDDCMIVQEDFNIILSNSLKFFKNQGLEKYNSKNHQGYLRHLVLRKGVQTEEIIVNIVTSSQVDYDMSDFVNMLLNLKLENSNIVGVLHTINDGLADVVKADELKVLYGRDYLYEKILGLKFKISPFSFFQTNTLGAEKLYEVARKYAGNDARDVIFDLYSGTGTIGQIMSPQANKVYGIEIVEEAVDAANENASLNGLDNCDFIAGDVQEKVSELGAKPDLIIVDPPRAGVSSKAVRDIASFGSDEIVYISCNARSLVGNIKEFETFGYRVDNLTIVDLFPNTPHVECVVLLSSNSNS